MSSSKQLARTIRHFVVVGFYIACTAIVVFAVIAVASLFHSGFGGWGGETEFTEVSGNDAKRRLGDAWPSQVDPNAVESVNHKSIWSRDTYSSWYRLQLTQNAAKSWIDHIHAREERQATMGDHPDDIEIVHGSITGPPTCHGETSDIPTWWSPPSIDFHTAKISYRLTYSAFDESTNILWIYSTNR